MTRKELVAVLADYATPYPDEEAFVQPFLTLLQHADAYQRTHLPGHLTGSAWIVNGRGSTVLLTHHAKLDRWLQPGGHADGDEDILRVARREAVEETGLTSLSLYYNGVFDIDIHPIPARGGFPQHLHYDIRFAFTADAAEQITVSDESHALAWTSLEQLASRTKGNRSILRMAEKTRSALFRADQ